MDSRAVYFALADGLSKYGGGENAARIACVGAIDMLTDSEQLDDSYIFSNIYKNLSAKIKSEQDLQSPFNKVSTTLNLVYFYSGKAYESHIGNSRTYCFKNKKIYSCTTDHSQAAEMVKAGIISENNLRSSKMRKVLLKSLGVDLFDNIQEITTPVLLEKGDDYLICTDGLWECITEENIEKALQNSENPHMWLSNMIKCICDADIKNKDNMSAIAIHINGVENDW